MSSRESTQKQLRTVFAAGAAGGLADGELLRRFQASRGEAAEAAFAVLVERHGPMVLRVCRSVLGDAHDAEDAFQATFLVLARRAGTVRGRDALGGWLYGVARRVAGCARSAAARRRKHETRAARSPLAATPERRPDLDLAPIVREELGRLPDRFGAALVLCDLEGLSCDEAAARLGWPVGTVKSRLSRGRDRLRNQLVRRGVAPAAGLLTATATAEAAPALLPLSRVESTARHALAFASGHPTAVAVIPAASVWLARRILMIAGLKTLVWAAGAVALLAAGSVGFAAWAGEGGGPTPAAVPQAGVPRAEAPKPAARPATAARAAAVLDEAVKMADEVEEPWMKAVTLADIAAVYARSGKPEVARTLFRRAEEQWERLGADESSRRYHALYWLAGAYAAARDREGTHSTVTRLLDYARKFEGEIERVNRYQLLSAGVETLSKYGATQDALRLVDGMKNASGFLRGHALAKVAGAQAREGSIAESRATMARADTEIERAEANEKATGILKDATRMAQVRGLISLAEAEAKAGQVEAARGTLGKTLALADRIGPPMRPGPLADIAAGYSRIGERDKADAGFKVALRLAEGLDRPGERDEGLARIAIALADAGDRDAARDALKRALDTPTIADGSRDFVSQLFDQARIKLGDWTEARLTILERDDRFLAEEATFRQTKAGEVESALGWARALAPGVLRVRALLGVARGLVE